MVLASFTTLQPLAVAPDPGMWECPPGIHNWTPPNATQLHWYPHQCANCWVELGGEWICGDGLDCHRYFKQATCDSCWDATANETGPGWHGPGWTCDVFQPHVNCSTLTEGVDCRTECWDPNLPGWICEPPPAQQP